MGLYEGSKGGGNVAKSGKVAPLPPDSGQNDVVVDGARHVQEHHEHAAADHDAQAAHHASIADAHDRLADHHRSEADYHRGMAGGGDRGGKA